MVKPRQMEKLRNTSAPLAKGTMEKAGKNHIAGESKDPQ
jgi:hypothetical protein